MDSRTKFTVTVDVKNERGYGTLIREIEMSMSDIEDIRAGNTPSRVRDILLDGEREYTSQLDSERKVDDDHTKKALKLMEGGMKLYALYTRLKGGESIRRDIVLANNIEEAESLIAHMGWWFDYGEKRIHEFEEWKGEFPSGRVPIASELLKRPSRFR